MIRDLATSITAAEPARTTAAAQPPVTATAPPQDAVTISAAAPASTPTTPPKPSGPFTGNDVEETVRYFSTNGRVYRKKFFVWKADLSVDEAAERLRDNRSVYVKHNSGMVDKIKSTEELQTLDTLDGAGRRPNLPEADVAALQLFEKGHDANDGMFCDKLFFFESKLNAYQAHKRLTSDKEKQVEVRYDTDSRMTVRNMDDMRDLHQWTQEMAKNPFTRQQAEAALEFIENNSGLFATAWPMRRVDIDPTEAMDNLRNGKAVRVPSPLGDHDDYVYNMRQLQTMDTIRGTQANPIMPKEQADALKFFEKGVYPKDGLYKDSLIGDDTRVDAYDGAERLLRERKEVGVRLRGKNYHTRNLKDMQELNALKGDGVNTILPDLEFKAIMHFDEQGLMAVGDKPADAYEAYQAMQKGDGARVKLSDRSALVTSATDCHELFSLEVSRQNTILPPHHYDLLQYWQTNGEQAGKPSYKVGGNEGARAYEALQSLQAKTELEVNSQGRWAPAASFQDLKDLAAFEGKGFASDVPVHQKDTLEYFQFNNERQGKQGFRADGRVGRAYEGWRCLRDGRPFETYAAGTWNTVTDWTSLHELDALLGRGPNDILPDDQFHLLKELGDEPQGEGLSTRGRRLNSYQSLQELKNGRTISYDFHGGDFGEVLQDPVKSLEDLDDCKIKINNQKEYDKYRYEVPELKDKLQRQKALLPDLADQNLKYGQNNKSTGESHLRSGESHKRSAESDRRSAESDLSSANTRLAIAYSMPMYITVTKYRTECDSNGQNCRQVPYQDQEFNFARQMAISAAQSDINSAQSEIQEAERRIRRAEQEIADARREIEKAEREIRDAQELLRMMGPFSQAVDSIDESTYREKVAFIQMQLGLMQSLSHVESLNRNLVRELKLIENMSVRPERPQGWSIPSPLVQY
jgi:hypothetical protein